MQDSQTNHLRLKNMPSVGKKKPQKKKLKERIPTIVSGELGQLYFQKKMDKKNEMERLKQERVAKKERKKEEKMKENKRKKRKRKVSKK